MKTIPEKTIDLFLCDLPYGCLTNQKGAKPFGRTTDGECNAGCGWDVKIDLVAFWEQVRRLCRNERTPVIMFCNARFGAELIQSNADWFRYDLIVDKEVGVSFLSVNKMPMKSHESVYIFSKKSSFYKRIDEYKEQAPAKYRKPSNPRKNKLLTHTEGISQPDYNQEENKRCVLSVIHDRLTKIKRHPTAKSVVLYKWLIERYSNEGDVVCDPTAGSFNSGRAAIELSRSYIGIEKDDKFFNDNEIKN